MNKKIGRPTTSLKEKTIKFRADEEFQAKLDFCSNQIKLNKSETLRQCLDILYTQLKAQSYKSESYEIN